MVEANDEMINLIKTTLTEEQISKLEQIYYFDQFCEEAKIAENAQSLEKEVKEYFVQANINKKEMKQICQDVFEKLNEANNSQSNEEESIEIEESEEEEIDEGQCEFCLRYDKITLHHAIPKLIIKRLKKKRNVKRASLVRYIKLCRYCHSFIHKIIPHAELAKKYNTIETLLNAEDLQDYVKKIRKQ